jgi:hypothetical protein
MRGKVPIGAMIAMPSAGFKLEIIIIHFLGLAPAVYLAAPDNGAERRFTGGCSQIPERETVNKHDFNVLGSGEG